MNADPIDIVGVGAVVATGPHALQAVLAGVPMRSRRAGALSGAARLALAAAAQCPSVGDSFDLCGAPDARTGICLGTRHGAAAVARRSLLVLREHGVAGLQPSWYAGGLANATSALLASACAFGGPNLSFLGQHAGLDALIHACRCLARHRADHMLAGGVDTCEAAAPPCETAASAAALLLLRRMAPPSNATDARPRLGRVLGWAQCRPAAASDIPAAIASLVRQATPAACRPPPIEVCALEPETHSASALLPLVELLRAGGGLRAWVAHGQQELHCVVIDSPAASGERE